MTDAPARPMPGYVIGILGLLAAVAPLAIDMYLPAFPTIADEFGTSPSAIQLTLTAFVIGLAVGQLVIGPLSDRTGRRPLLIAGPVLFTLAAVTCALAPAISLFTAARFVQGFGGAAGVVLSRAVISDRAEGVAAARLFSVMMLISGVAPVAAPLLGGTFISIIGWRGVFWVLAGLGVVMLIGAVGWVRESLPRAERRTGGLSTLTRDARRLATDREFVGYTLTFAFAFGTMFAYIAASPFVLQDMLGLSQFVFAMVFAANGLGIVIMNAVNARLVRRFPPRQLMLLGVGVMVVATAFIIVDAVLGPWLWPTILAFWCAVSSLGLIMPNSTALAIARSRHAAGTGSAVLGALQFGLGALVAPLVGVGGSMTAVPMALVMFVCALIALAATRLTTS